MPAPHSTHPSPEDLAAFAVGKLSDAEAEAVALHLAACPNCRRAAERAHADSFIARLKAAGVPGASADTRRPGAAQPVPPAPLELPPELANHPRYRILRELGRGGMGVVYHAEQILMHRPVAIKVISKALLDHADSLERFRREVEAAAKLAHPNIVIAHDAEQAGELHMLVMEFVEGQSLDQVLRRKGPLPVVHACHYVRQAALGLQHAFERGMVHRDIKPQNLMLTPRGQIKILDFGLAKLASERGAGAGLTAANAYMGTPDYSAPEQATDARTADIRADIYSLGCTLYCLLAGRPPFHEETAVQTILAHLEKDPPPLPALRPDVPEALGAVVARMLAKDPAQRFQKPVEVSQALLPFIKPGRKAPPPVAVVPAPTDSPGRRTMTADDTSQPLSALKGPPVPRPPISQASAAAPEPSVPKGRTIPAVLHRKVRQTRPASTASWRQRWLLLAGAGVAVLGLVVLLGVVLRLRTRDGVVVPEHVLATGPTRAPAPPVPKPPEKVLAYRHGGGSWRVDGDELVQEDPNAGIPFILFGDASWTDFDMTLEARRVEGTGLCTVPFRVESLLDFWYFVVVSRTRHMTIAVDGTRKPIGNKGWTIDDAWHKIGVRVRGEHIQCFMDDDSVFDFTDSRHPRGAVGIVSPDKSASRFRNLKVADASGRVLVDGVRSLEFAAERGDPPAADQAQAETVWKGVLRQMVNGQYPPDEDALIKIRKREGTRFEAELWRSNETQGAQIVGTIDGLANITWKATAILAGDRWVSNVQDVLMMGAVKGKQLRAVGYFGGPQNLIAEVIVTRDN
jgi:serine/threonine protein kinase